MRMCWLGDFLILFSVGKMGDEFLSPDPPRRRGNPSFLREHHRASQFSDLKKRSEVPLVRFFAEASLRFFFAVCGNEPT